MKAKLTIRGTPAPCPLEMQVEQQRAQAGEQQGGADGQTRSGWAPSIVAPNMANMCCSPKIAIFGAPSLPRIVNRIGAVLGPHGRRFLFAHLQPLISRPLRCRMLPAFRDSARAVARTVSILPQVRAMRHAQEAERLLNFAEGPRSSRRRPSRPRQGGGHEPGRAGRGGLRPAKPLPARRRAHAAAVALPCRSLRQARLTGAACARPLLTRPGVAAAALRVAAPRQAF